MQVLRLYRDSSARPWQAWSTFPRIRPMARGRSERLNRTFQGPLVNERPVPLTANGILTGGRIGKSTVPDATGITIGRPGGGSIYPGLSTCRPGSGIPDSLPERNLLVSTGHRLPEHTRRAQWRDLSSESARHRDFGGARLHSIGDCS